MKRFILTVVGLFFILISSTRAYSKSPGSIVPSPWSSYYAVWAQTGEPIVAQNEKLPLNPASNVKLITSYCALKELGSDHRFGTWFYSDESMQNDAVHNLWVKGEGDPSMVNESLLAMVQGLKNIGLKNITGDIFIDASYFDDQDYPGRRDNNEKAYNAPTSATPLNFNSVEVQIQSDGKRALVQLVPDTPYLKLQNHLRLGGRRSHVYIDAKHDSGAEIITVSGRLPSRSGPFSLYHSVHRPTEFFGYALGAFLQQVGITLGGKPKMGTVAGTHLIWKWESKPLREIIADMNKFSNNFIAEQLTKYLGAFASGAPGTTQKGVSFLKSCLTKTGIDTSNLYLENGSGLSYNNQVTAQQLVKVLTAGFRDPSIREDFISSLSVAGVDGTMKSRRTPKELEGVLRAKTGSLNGISSLAGFIPAADGQTIAFAILMNDLRKSLREAHRIQDELVLKWTALRKLRN